MPKDSIFYYFGLVTQLGLTIIVTILVGLGIGIVLDKFVGTKGVCTVLFLLIGIGAGFMNAYREIMRQKR
jgi:ATP synthase protein I